MKKLIKEFTTIRQAVINDQLTGIQAAIVFFGSASFATIMVAICEAFN